MAKRINSGKKIVGPKKEDISVEAMIFEEVSQNDSVKLEDFEGEKILEDISNEFGKFGIGDLLGNEMVNDTMNSLKEAEEIVKSFNNVDNNFEEAAKLAEEQLSKLNKINNNLDENIKKLAESQYDKHLKNSIFSDFWNGVSNNGWI